MDELKTIASLFSGIEVNIDNDQPQPLQRLIKAYNNGAKGIDLAVLLHQELRYLAYSYNDPEKAFNIPWSDRLPHRKTLKEHGINVTEPGEGVTEYRATMWKPLDGWLTEANLLDRDAFELRKKYENQLVTGDFFLSFWGHSEYKCQGQKQALRSSLLAPVGSTLVINLPTGSGKSLCYQALTRLPFIDNDSITISSGLTIVVVPTTALAIDQETIISELCYPTAYYSGDNKDNQQRREIIYKNILNGKQPIVFTSPESLLGSLKYAIYEAAKKGTIKALIIDECHMIDQWGDEFRPSFQLLSGFRKSLMEICPNIRTILLSATLTEAALKTIYSFYFAPNGLFKVISSVQLRPEPTYWVSRCNSDEEKMDRILEALRYLPRPLIMYTTLVSHANNWFRLLRECGYNRLRVMTGKTGQNEREDIIRGWKNDEFDIVVATSAFGLGVDKGNVRTILHACMPETLDRFYQEVGRGGRDGYPSISLLIYTHNEVDSCDYSIAKSLNYEAVITPEKGFQRWSAMFSRKTPIEGEFGRFTVPLNAIWKPELVPDSDLNKMWNARTLNLMHRAKIISLTDNPPKHYNPAVDHEERDIDKVVIDILSNAHCDQLFWESDTNIKEIREQLSKDNKQQFDLMRAFLSGNQCAANILGKAYKIDQLNFDQYELHIHVAKCCSGCQWCRRNHVNQIFNTPSQFIIPWEPVLNTGNTIRKYFMNSKFLPIFYEQEIDNRRMKVKLAKILRWLLGQRVNCIISSTDLLISLMELDANLRKELSCSPLFLLPLKEFHDPRTKSLRPRVPSVFLYENQLQLTNSDFKEWMMRVSSASSSHEPWIVCIPINMEHPEKNHVKLYDYFKNSVRIDGLIEEQML